MTMDVCHLLLGRTWEFDRGAVHDGRKNQYTFEKDGVQHTRFPLEGKDTTKNHNPKVLLLSGRSFMQQIKEVWDEVSFALIMKTRVVLTATNVMDLPVEI